MSVASPEQGLEMAEVVSPAGLILEVADAAAAGAAVDGQQKKKTETDLPAAYLAYLDEMRKAWGDLPELTITYDDFSYTT